MTLSTTPASVTGLDSHHDIFFPSRKGEELQRIGIIDNCRDSSTIHQTYHIKYTTEAPGLLDGQRPSSLARRLPWGDTLHGASDAVTAYAERKKDHLNTAASCQVGIDYLPRVWEVQGGCTAETRAFLHRLVGLIATVEGVDVLRVKARLSLLSCWLGGRAVRRRRRAAETPAHVWPHWFWKLESTTL